MENGFADKHSELAFVPQAPQTLGGACSSRFTPGRGLTPLLSDVGRDLDANPNVCIKELDLPGQKQMETLDFESALQDEFNRVQENCSSFLNQLLTEASARIIREHLNESLMAATNAPHADGSVFQVTAEEEFCPESLQIMFKELARMEGAGDECVERPHASTQTAFTDIKGCENQCQRAESSERTAKSSMKQVSDLAGRFSMKQCSEHTMTKQLSDRTRKSSGRQCPERSGKTSHKKASVLTSQADSISSMQRLNQRLSAARRNNHKEELDPSTWAGFVRNLLQSGAFDVFISAIILSNSIFMGVQIDWQISHPRENMFPLGYYVVNWGYTLTFTIELVMRMFDERISFFYRRNPNAHWNALDVFIVGSSWLEVYFDVVLFISDGPADGLAGGGSPNQLKIIRLVRISRLVKVFRIARIVRFVAALRTLVYSIVCTLKSVYWAMLLMLLIIYVFAMILAQAVSGHLMDEQIPRNPDIKLVRFWDGLITSMITLFKSIAGGISWHEVLEPLVDVGSGCYILFISFVVFVYFAVLNVITGVFCESAIQSAKNDVDLVIQEAVASKKAYVKKLQTLFTDIDEDESKMITVPELHAYLDKELSGALFEFLELEVANAGDIIRLIDVDGSGELDMDEFVEGICRLRGPAKAVDIAYLAHDHRMFQDNVTNMLTSVENLLMCSHPELADTILHQRHARQEQFSKKRASIAS